MAKLLSFLAYKMSVIHFLLLFCASKTFFSNNFQNMSFWHSIGLVFIKRYNNGN